MRLSIFNYGLDPNATVPKYAKNEDDKLVSIAESIIEKHSFGRGAVIVSETFHTGLINFNNRKYMEKGMENSIMSFYNPHITPFLMHHETGGGGFFGGGNPNLISVGSNLFASYIKRKLDTPTGPATGYGKVVTFIPEGAEVDGQSAIGALRSRRLLSLSIGSRVSDKDYRCSICGESRYSEECTHTLGEVYEGKICCVEVYNPLFREYSAVYTPSDINAIVRRVDVNEGEGSEDPHMEVDQNPSMGYINIYEGIGRKVFPSTELNKGGDDMVNSKDTKGDVSVKDSIDALIVKYEKTVEAKDMVIAEKDRVISTLAKTLAEKLDKDLVQEEQEEDLLPEEETPTEEELVGEDADPEENEEEPGEETPPVDEGREEGSDTEEDTDATNESDDPSKPETNEAGNEGNPSPDNSQPDGKVESDVAPDPQKVTEESQAGPETQGGVPPKEGGNNGSADTTEPKSTESVRDILAKGRYSRFIAGKPGVHRDPILVARAAK
jgi:hypothetical protein